MSESNIVSILDRRLYLKWYSSRYPWRRSLLQWWWIPLSHPFRFIMWRWIFWKLFPFSDLSYSGFGYVFFRGIYPFHSSLITLMSLLMYVLKKGLNEAVVHRWYIEPKHVQHHLVQITELLRRVFYRIFNILNGHTFCLENPFRSAWYQPSSGNSPHLSRKYDEI